MPLSRLGFVFVVSFALCLLVSPSGRAQTTATWEDAVSGDFRDPTKWSTGVVPNNGTPTSRDSYHVVIDGLGTAYSISLTSLPQIELDGLTINSADAELYIAQGSSMTADSLTLSNGTLHVDGSFAAGTVENRARIYVGPQNGQQGVTLGGTQFHNSGLIEVEAGSYLTLRGTINTEDLGLLINRGNSMLIGNINNIDRALDLNKSSVGLIEFGNSSLQTIQDSRIKGGIITSSAAGPFEVKSKAIGFEDTTIGADILLSDDASVLTIVDHLILDNATIRFSGSKPRLRFKGENASQIIDGAGKLIIDSRPGTHSNGLRMSGFRQVILNEGIELIFAATPGVSPYDTLDAEYGFLLKGKMLVESGRVAVIEDAKGFQNDGDIYVEDGAEILFGGDGEQITRAPLGRIHQEVGGLVTLSNTTLDLQGGILRLQEDDVWQLESASIKNGRLETDVNAALRVSGMVGGTLRDVTLAGSVQLTPGRSLSLYGDINFDGGQISFADGGSTIGSTVLYFEPESTIQGVGEIVFDRSGAIIQDGFNPILILPEGITARSGLTGGQVGGVTGGSTINRGTVIAAGGMSMNLFDTTVTNEGTIVAKDNGIVRTGADRGPFGGSVITNNPFMNKGTIILENGKVDTRVGITSNTESGVIAGEGVFDTTKLENGGVISPGGNDIGSLQVVGDVLLKESGSIRIDIQDRTGGSGHDYLDVQGNLNLGGTIDLADGSILKPSKEYRILHASGSVSGTFKNLAQDDLVGNFGGVDVFIDYLAGRGSDVALYTGFKPLSFATTPGTELVGGLSVPGLDLPQEFRTEITGNARISIGQDPLQPPDPITQLSIFSSILQLADKEQFFDLGILGSARLKLANATVQAFGLDAIPVEADGSFSTENVGLRFAGGTLAITTTGVLSAILSSRTLDLITQPEGFGREDLLGYIRRESIGGQEVLSLELPFDITSAILATTIPADIKLTGIYRAQAAVVPEMGTLGLGLAGSISIFLLVARSRSRRAV